MLRKNITARKINFRSFHFESLESRELLSVSAADFNAIKAQYSDLSLSNYADYNIIEITANELSDAKIRAAITEAGTTTKNDLIVVRTTAAQNKITLGGSALAIDIDSPSSN